MMPLVSVSVLIMCLLFDASNHGVRTMPKLTKRTVDTAAPAGRVTFVWDTELRGFGLKVTPGGTKTYLVQYRMGGRESPTRRKTIGRHGGPWTPSTARKEAERLLRMVRQGKDPVALEKTRRREAVDLAFENYAGRFVERYAKRNRSWPETERILKRDLQPALKGRPLPEITRGEIAHILDGIADRAPALARHAYAILRKLFRWAVDRGDIERSPMEGMAPPARVPARDRVLVDDELARIWRACETLGHPFGPLVRLLILTGGRREEIGALRWEEVGAEEIRLAGARNKTGEPRTIPLTPAAMAILDSLPRISNPETHRADFVFTVTGRTAVSGWGKAKRTLDAEIDVTGAPWRLHDLRRTVATGLQRLGVRLEVTEAVLGHISGSRAGIVGVYQRYDWETEKRAALEAWGAHIDRLLAGETDAAKVVPLHPVA